MEEEKQERLESTINNAGNAYVKLFLNSGDIIYANISEENLNTLISGEARLNRGMIAVVPMKPIYGVLYKGDYSYEVSIFEKIPDAFKSNVAMIRSACIIDFEDVAYIAAEDIIKFEDLKYFMVIPKHIEPKKVLKDAIEEDRFDII